MRSGELGANRVPVFPDGGKGFFCRRKKNFFCHVEKKVYLCGIKPSLIQKPNT